MPTRSVALPDDVTTRFRTVLTQAWPEARHGAAALAPFTALFEAVGTFTRVATTHWLSAEDVYAVAAEQVSAVTAGAPNPRPFAELVERLVGQCLDEVDQNAMQAA
jgi:hypothetical protein